jgi:hypothetical protein
MPVPSSARLHNGSTAISNGAELSVVGLGAATIQISGTFVATILFEGSVDGTTFFSIPVIPVSGGLGTLSANAPGAFRVNTAGLAEIRARISSYTSGSVTIDAIAIDSNGPDTGRGDPATRWEIITPDNNVDLSSRGFRSIFIGGPGDIAAIGIGDTTNGGAGTSITFRGLIAGQVLPVAPRKILATGTTATFIIGMA